MMNKQFILIDFLTGICIVFAIVFIGSCKTKNPSHLFTNSSQNAVNYERVEFEEVYDQPTFDNKCIEIKGRFSSSMEAQTLSSLTEDRNQIQNSLWISFENESDSPLIEVTSKKKLLGDGYWLTYLSGKNITLKGQVNMKNHGHLGQYKGAIEHITFVSVP